MRCPSSLKITLLALITLSVAACSGGDGGQSGSTAIQPLTVTGSVVKGPLAHAVVKVYQVDASTADLKGALVDEGVTDATAQITSLTLPQPMTGAYLVDVASDSNTIDLSTGQAPIITTLTTLLSAEQIQDRIVVSPLTTLAVALTRQNTQSTDDANAVLASLAEAVDTVQTVFDFGMKKVTFLTLPAMVTEKTTADKLEKIAAHRTLIEALTAVVGELARQSDTDMTGDEILAQLAVELKNGDNPVGALLGQINAMPVAFLPIPNTDQDSDPDTVDPYTVDDVEKLLLKEIQTLQPDFDVFALMDGSIEFIPAPLGEDTDEDGYPDAGDNCPSEANSTQTDTNDDDAGDSCDLDDDGDGVEDTQDAFPVDADEAIDTDSDGVGNNTDTDDDGDVVADAEDRFPLDDAETLDTDSDGLGNNADADDDGDSVPDINDDLPLDMTESVDTDHDGLGNNEDLNDDGDSVNDDEDLFPLNPSEKIDSDSDGVGNTADLDDDNDGKNDFGDAFPLNAAETVDNDVDGIGNNADTNDDGDALSDVDDAFRLDFTNGGSTDSTPVTRFYNTTDLSDNNGLSFNPTLAVDNNGAAYIAWNDDSFGNMEIMLVRTLDSGKTYSSPLNITNNSGLSTFPSLEVAPDGVLHMVYQDGENGQTAIYYTRSTDQGLSFSTPEKLSEDGVVAVNATITIDKNGNLYVAYSTVDALFVARSTDGGNTVPFPVRSQQGVRSYVSSQLVVDQRNDVHLVWADSGEIMYSLSMDAGDNFRIAQNLSNTALSSKTPSLGTDTLGNVFVTWCEEIEDSEDPTDKTTEIYLSKSSNGGITFSEAANVSENEGISIEPDLNVDINDNVHIAWQDTTPGNYEAVYSVSTDQGATFLPMINIAPSEFGSLITKIKTDDDGTIFIAWDDNRTGDFEATITTGRADIAGITAQASPQRFTPDDDGRDEVTRITASFTEFLQWTLVIEDESGAVVASTEGSGNQLDVIWDGVLGAGELDTGALGPSGLYTFRITGVDLHGREAVPTSSKVELSDGVIASTPVITLFEASPFIDPDGDGRRDSAEFDGDFNKFLDWKIDLVDGVGNVIYTASGTDLSFHLVWDGMDKNTGIVAIDGDYTLQLVAVDAVGQTVSDSRPITVDSVNPEQSNLVSTPSFSPNGDGVDDVGDIDFDISEGALVTIYVYEEGTGSLVRELSRNAFTSATHVSKVWDGLNGGGTKVAAGNYEYYIWIRDYAANRAIVYPIKQPVEVTEN